MTTAPPTLSPGQLVRDTFETLFVRKDVDAVRDLWTENSVDHFLALGIDAKGPDQLAAFFKGMLAAFPDFDMTIENVIENDRHAVVQWTAVGTFDGEPFQGIEPTGKRVTMRGCDVFRFSEDGKLEVNTVYHDGAQFARDIGMLPPRDSAADHAVLAAFNASTRLRRRLKRR